MGCKQKKEDKDMFKDTAYTTICIGLLDLLIAVLLACVTYFRKYNFRIIIFIGCVWCFVMAFLSTISFGITIALRLPFESVISFVNVLIQLACGYIILSYFRLVCSIAENTGEVEPISYLPEEDTNAPVFTGLQLHVQAHPASPPEEGQEPKSRRCFGMGHNDKTPILDDQDDLEFS